MALPSSGQLSINDIVGEFGGSAPHSLSEYYRGGSFVSNSATNSNVPTSGQIKITDFYGAASEIWSTTVTVGSGNNFGYTAYGFVRLGNTFGSATDTTIDFFSGASLISLYYSFTTTGVVVFAASGAQSNAGFTSVNIDGNTYNRTDATFSQPLGTTSWTWDVGSGTNPFGTTNGVTKLVTFN